MELFFYIMIFIMGTFFGSFFTLAVYRIPLKKDITHERSFCPNCNHKLNFLDLIPVVSYIFLKGKCRYCGEKVRIRYLLLEVLSGIVFVLAYFSLNIQDVYFEIDKIIAFVFFVFMYVTLVLVGGIDKEYRKINVSVLLFGAVCQLIYILYLYIIEATSVYRYSIYFAIFVVLLIIHIILQKKREIYAWQIVILCSYIVSILGFKAIVFILILTTVIALILLIFKKEPYINVEQMPIGFLITISTIVYQLVYNFMQFYII